MFPTCVIGPVVAVERGGEFADFLNEPKEGFGAPAFAVDLFVLLRDESLEIGEL
jgi:hypothetical protein